MSNISIEMICTAINIPIKVIGENELHISKLSSLEAADERSLIWISENNPEAIDIAKHTEARVIICALNEKDVLHLTGKCFLLCNNPKLAFVYVANKFFAPNKLQGIDKSAVVDSTAVIDPSAYIGTGCVIESNVKIGKGTEILSNTHIFSNVEIADNVSIGPSCSIGKAGFGYVKDISGNNIPFPQIGKVIIGSDVDIGANTCIDRGALSDTVIGDNVKIDNLCQIAHNVVIKNSCIITAGAALCGGVVLEENAWIGPSSSILENVVVGKGALIGLGSVVTKNISANSTAYGVPAVEKK